MAGEIPTPVEALRGHQLRGLSNLANLDYANDVVDPEIRGKNFVVISHAGDDMNVAAGKVESALQSHGVTSTVRLHDLPSSEVPFMLQHADGVYIAGGNTFGLVVNMEAMRNPDGSLIDTRPQAATEPISDYLKEAASKGLVIMGHSAGLMIMGRDIRTCLDPRSYVAKDGSVATRGLNLMPFSFHPHFNPETESEELSAYPKADTSARIFGVQNESFITVRDGNVQFHGVGGAIFEAGKEPMQIQNGTNLNPLIAA